MIDDAAKKALAVARQMGAADSGVTAYHGSFSPDIKKFDQSKLGQRFNNAASRHGMWLSTNPEDADFYGPHTYQTTLHGKFKQLPSMEELGDKVKDRLSRVSMNPNVNYETSQQAERMLDFYNATQDPRLYTGAASAAINKAKREGYHGAVLKGGETVQENSPPGDNYVVFHPETLDLRRLKASGGMIDDPAKAIRRAVLVAKGLSRAIGPMPGKDEGERVHPASLLPGVHVQAIEPQNFAGGGEVGDNPNFKKWFGNSVLHDNGTPRKYYTGTSKDKDFSAFNVGRHGAWFTTDPHEASMYATTNDSQGHVYESGQYKSTNTASRVIPAYLKAENPYTGGLPVGVQSQNYKKSQSDWFDKLRAAGHDAWVPEELGGRLAVMLRHPTQIKSAVTNTGDYDPSKPRIDRAFGGEVQPTDETGFDAFHGTPHSFEPEPGAPLGRFRSDKIGTGEGAQAFGHGLYVGEEGTALGYRKSVGRKRLIEIARDSYDEHDNPQAAEKALFSHPELSPSDKNLLTELKKEDYLGFDYPHQAISAAMGKNAGNYDISPALKNAMNTHGHIYHVRVNANPEHFLDWDKPLSEQHPAIQRVAQTADISAAKGKTKGVLNAWREGRDVGVEATGKDLHHALSDYGENSPAAARALHAAGIPGIRYLDANSRGPTGNPTHNHVIFDPSIIDIKRRYKRGGDVDMHHEMAPASIAMNDDVIDRALRFTRHHTPGRR